MHREEGVMELIIRQRHDRLGEDHYAYLESRLNRLGRYMDTLEHATVELTEERRSAVTKSSRPTWRQRCRNH
jgi:hypothetical protein